MKKPLLALAISAMLVALAFYSCKNMGSSSGSNAMYNSKSKPATELSSKVALAWVDLLLDQVRAQRVGPPPASRALAYLSIAMYQSALAGIPDGHSMEGQLKGFNNLPKPDADKEYDWNTVLNNAAYLVCDEGLARYMGPNTTNLKTLVDKTNHMLDSMLNNKEVFNRSMEYGKHLGDAVLDYMKTDQYDFTRENNIYESPTRGGDPAHPERWEPTDITKTAYEPYWGRLRPLGIDTSELCQVFPSMKYSEDPKSDFCQFCDTVYGIDTSFTEYNRIASLYWADDPIETFTPPGHWTKIAKQQIIRHNFNLAQTCEFLCYFEMSEYNASISMWKTKYDINRGSGVRPKTYINEVMNKADWEPYIETPPFPEYPSGHSGFSGAATEVLTKYFGDNVQFTDSTDVVIALNPRTYKSFYAASTEAGYSRMYGGIHFKAAIVDGITLGRCCADNVMKDIKLGSGTSNAMASK